MIGSAIHLKNFIEGQRSANIFGNLIWQLNEIWPTGGWGSLEYGTPAVKGQVVGGRWKPLHYLLRASTFKDQIVTCQSSGQCVVKNDSPFIFTGSAVISFIHFTDGQQDSIITHPFNVSGGAGVTQWFCLNSACDPLSAVLASFGCNSSGVDCIIDASVYDNSNQLVSQNIVPLTAPQQMQLSPVTIKTNVVADGDSATIEIVSSGVAAYVVLTTQAQGRFSDNAFLMLPGSRNIQFITFGSQPFDMNLLATTLRVEHVQQYQS